MQAAAAQESKDPETKYWCWTYYCPKEDVDTEGLPLYTNDKAYPSKCMQFRSLHNTIYEITYVCYQEEKCPETKRLHLQGYMEVHKDVKRSILKKAFCPTIHWEKRVKSAKEASDYCKKDDTATGRFKKEDGILSDQKPGKRNDVKRVADAILENTPLAQVAKENPETWMRLYRGATDLANKVQAKPKDIDRTVFILFGEPGTGKTSWAKHYIEENGLSYYCPDSNNGGKLSFEAYEGEQALLIDDYEENALSAQALKTLMDRYATKLPGRGVSKWALHTHVFITSNYPIEQWFPALKSQTERVAVERRCKAVIQCGRDKWTILAGMDFEEMQAKNNTVWDNPMKSFLKPASAASSTFAMAPVSSGNKTLKDLEVRRPWQEEDYGPIEIDSDNESELF